MTFAAPSLQDHADAILDLLLAADEISPDLVVYEQTDGGPNLIPDNAAPPFAVVHVVAHRDLGVTLDMQSSRMRVRGGSRILSKRRRTATPGRRPTRVCRRSNRPPATPTTASFWNMPTR